ncbi:hypothetical protein ACWC09_22915 [Streptomyces sp. NPDC001617]
MQKNCFVIMPIRKAGTPEHKHFRSLRDLVIEPVIKNLGLTVTRADDIAKGGAIVAGIIHHLATADLVIADLTDLNPNVFYEIGVRHALRGKGTVMIVDTSRTETPFDLKPYRMIEFTPDLEGIEKLRMLLDRFSRDILEEAGEVQKDNPVHDFLPSLPTDIFSHVEGSIEGELREEISSLRASLSRYGFDSVSETRTADAASVVSEVLSKSQRGELPADLFSQARSAAQDENRTEFLNLIMQLVNDSPFVIAALDWAALSGDAQRLNLPEISLVLRERALQLRPNDQGLKRMHLSALAHSEDPRHRERAREELAALLNMSWDDGELRLPAELEKRHLGTFGLMLDAYHRDGLDGPALKITTALVEKYPECTVSLRNHARALSRAERKDEAEDWYRRAVLAGDVDDVSAEWLGNELGTNAERLIDAIESYLRACELDPQDSDHFAQVADEIAEAAAYKELGVHSNQRLLPDEISTSSVVDFLAAAFSCTSLTPETIKLARSAILEAELRQGILDDLVAVRQGSTKKIEGRDISLLARRERLQLVREHYALVHSDLTKPE